LRLESPEQFSIFREFLIPLCPRRKNQDAWNCTSQVGVLDLVVPFLTTSICLQFNLVWILQVLNQTGVQMFGLSWHLVPFLYANLQFSHPNKMASNPWHVK
jgi:hypothetical protein